MPKTLPPSPESPADGGRAPFQQRLRLALARLDAALPIAFKLAIPVLVLVLAGGILLGWSTYRTEANRIRADFKERALLISRSMEASVTAHGLAENDENLPDEIQRHVDALVQVDPLILLMDAYGLQDGTPSVIASSDPGRIGASGAVLEHAEEQIQAIYAPSAVTHSEEEYAGQPALGVRSPLRLNGEPALAVCVYISTVERDQALAALLRTFIIGVGGVLLLVPLVLFLVLRFLIFGRLRRLLAATARMQKGDYGARVEGVITCEARDEMLQLSSRFNAMAEAIQTLHGRMQSLASTDELTGLFNRRYIMEALEREIPRARRGGQPLAAIIMDLDGLKAVNDCDGHAAGDEALRQAAQALRSAVRAGDLTARFGGDEFVALLPDCDADALRSVLERAHRDVERLGAMGPEDGAPCLTVSAGGAMLRDGDDADTLLHRADLGLYEAKSDGRNRVRVAA